MTRRLPWDSRVRLESGFMTRTAESTLRAKVRAELPPDAFVRRPLRILLAVPLIAVIAGISALLVATPLPWYATLLAWAVLGNAYVALMFFGHEVAHGAMVRSERLQNAVLAFSLGHLRGLPAPVAPLAQPATPRPHQRARHRPRPLRPARRARSEPPPACAGSPPGSLRARVTG